MVYRFSLERDELSDRLGGGLPNGALAVVEGEFGTGKSIICERLLYGLLKNNAKVSFVSTELTTLHFIEQMHSLDYPVEEHIFNRSLLFLPVYPVLGFRGTKHDLVDRLINAKKMYESDVVILDAFSSLVKDWSQALPDGTTEQAITERIEDLLYLFKLLNAKGKSVILTLQPGDVPDSIAAVLKAAADVYLSLRLDSVGGIVSRSVFVRRYRARPRKPSRPVAREPRRNRSDSGLTRVVSLVD